VELLDERLVLVVRVPDLALQGGDQLVPLPEQVVASLGGKFENILYLVRCQFA
jgi:hypothetical protein